MSLDRLLPGATLVLVLLALPPGAADAQRLIREGRIERLLLADGEALDGWAVTEGTLEPSGAHARAGRALLFHIPVDWHAGEVKYPIGWPRCWLKIPPEAQDWAGWERLRFWIYADTSRDELPNLPVTLLITTTGPRSNWSRDLSLRKGEAVELVFPLDDLPDRDQAQEIKLSISESRYKDGDTVDFYLDDLELTRFTEPTVVSLEPLARVGFADDPALPVMVEVLGLPPGEKAEIRLALMNGDAAVATTTAEVPAGRTRMALRLPPGLAAGDYRLVVPGQDAAELGADLRLLDSPWQGGDGQ